MRERSRLRRTPQQVYVVQGEPYTSEALRIGSGQMLGWNHAVPRRDQVFAL